VCLIITGAPKNPRKISPLGNNHRQLLRYEKKRIRFSIWHQKETYFKKQLGFENVSWRAEFHSKICDQLIEA
jgi:hypothetical protein